MDYLINKYVIRKENGVETKVSGFTDYNKTEEYVQKLLKEAKERGYKYVGRFHDKYNNYYTQYERKDEKKSTSECERIYRIKIYKLI